MSQPYQPYDPYQSQSATIPASSRLAAILAHLSAPIAALLSAGSLSLLGPLIVWLVKKNDPYARRAAAGAWPDREAAGGDDAGFAKQLGDMRKVVVSRGSHEFPWRNSEVIEGDLVDAVAALKADAGITGILIPGSISVVQQLLAAGLVDELRLLVHPVAARKGRRLFDDGDAPYHLEVTSTEAFPTGVIRVIYTPATEPAEVGYDEVTDQVPDGR